MSGLMSELSELVIEPLSELTGELMSERKSAG